MSTTRCRRGSLSRGDTASKSINCAEVEILADLFSFQRDTYMSGDYRDPSSWICVWEGLDDWASKGYEYKWRSMITVSRYSRYVSSPLAKTSKHGICRLNNEIDQRGTNLHSNLLW